MAKVIAWSRVDGCISITVPFEKKNVGETEVEWLDRVSAKVSSALPGLTKLGYFDESELPPTKTYFNQWRFVSGRIVEDANLMKAEKWKAAKKKRNGLLDDAIEGVLNAKDDDDQQMITKWKQYRKKLRDIEKDYTDPDAIVWPTVPS